jgi:hypothetical protein
LKATWFKSVSRKSAGIGDGTAERTSVPALLRYALVCTTETGTGSAESTGWSSGRAIVFIERGIIFNDDASRNDTVPATAAMKAEYTSGDDMCFSAGVWLESDLWEDPLAWACFLMRLWVARLDDLKVPLDRTGRIRMLIQSQARTFKTAEL